MEQFANKISTALNAGINNAVTTIPVVSTVGFPSIGTFRILVDAELMLVTAVSGSFTVVRGAEGTTAASHLNGAAVTLIITAGAIAQIKADIIAAQVSYTEVHFVGHVRSTTVLTPGEVIGAREFNLALIPAGTKQLFLVATLQSSAPAAVANVQLWDVTNGVMVTGAAISNTAEGDRTVFGTSISAALTVGVSPGNIRTDVASEYELRLLRSGGLPADIVTCSNAHLRIIWS
jgi:hypothetical protein